MKVKLSHVAILLASYLLCTQCAVPRPLGSTNNSDVTVVGAMRLTMWKGQIQGAIRLDTLPDRTHLNGIGPLAYLAGELMVVDGRSFQARVLTDSTMQVEESFEVEAPFFVYARVPAWRQQALPDSITSLAQLDAYLTKISSTRTRPFAFKLTGHWQHARIHLVNLPPGATVSSPQEAHQGLVHYSLGAVEATAVGFFSTQHQGVFTHHDTYVHAHLLTADRRRMGHLEEARFAPGALRLWLPEE